MAEVVLKNFVNRYGATQVIHGVDLKVQDGELCVFVAPSGAENPLCCARWPSWKRRPKAR